MTQIPRTVIWYHTISIFTFQLKIRGFVRKTSLDTGVQTVQQRHSSKAKESLGSQNQVSARFLASTLEVNSDPSLRKQS